MPQFSERSRKNLETCDKRLQDIFNEVIKGFDCTILCGSRNKEEQDKAFEQGYSQLKYPDSKHNFYPSKAVDAAPYPINWNDRERFSFMAGYVKATADRLGIKIKWGGSWEIFVDRPHFELDES